MITVDTRGTTAYSPLIPAIKAMCNAVPGETLEIIMNHADAFQDLKEYLSEQSIGFREIYDGEQLTVQFTIAKSRLYTGRPLGYAPGISFYRL